MKRTTNILILCIAALLISSCGGSVKSKIVGKWRWVSIESLKTNDPIKMDDEELYLIFKDGQYLYHNASTSSSEDWTKATPYKIDNKSKRLSIMSQGGDYELEHYTVKFKGINTLLLTNDDAGSVTYQSIWTLKRAK